MSTPKSEIIPKPPSNPIWTTARIGGVKFVCTELSTAVSNFLDILTLTRQHPGTTPITVRFANSYSVALAQKTESYRRVLNSAGLTFADGVPVHWVTSRLRAESGTTSTPVRGPEFFPELLSLGRETGIRHYFIGTTEDTLKLLRAKLEMDYPGIIIVGTYAPPFEPVSDRMIGLAQAAMGKEQIDVVWVALGTPKEDYFARDLADRCGIPCLAVGAAFDFQAGVLKAAPSIVRRSGFEWLFRLAMEPGRLWRRYLFGNAKFLHVAARSLTRPADVSTTILELGGTRG